MRQPLTASRERKKMTATDTNGSGKAVRTFPAGFVWDVAAAAYQIEGAATTDAASTA